MLPRAGQLFIPPAVRAELLTFEEIPDWLRVVALTAGFAIEAKVWENGGFLHRGEAEALALARQLSAEWLLTDDAAARLLGQQNGVEVHGSLGFVLWAAAAGNLDQIAAERAFDALASSSLWISGRVLREAKRAIREIFAAS